MLFTAPFTSPRPSSISSLSSGPVFVTCADGELGHALVKGFLGMSERHPHLSELPVYAALSPRASPEMTADLENLGAQCLLLDPLRDQDRDELVRNLTGASKLCLLVDPLVAKNSALLVARSYIDAARAAAVEHVVFLTPFSPWDPSVIPTANANVTTTTTTTTDKASDPLASYRSQFLSMEAYLSANFPADQVTIIRYPGILQQHLKYFSKYIATHNALPLPNNPNMTIESCNIVDIVRACSYIVYAPASRYGNKVVKITGPNLLTLQELVERLSDSLDCVVQIHMMTVCDMRDILLAALPDEDAVTYILEMWGVHDCTTGAGRRWEITRDLEALTGEGGVSLEDYLQSMLQTIDVKQ